VATVVPDVAGHAVERYYVLRRALCTLSVITVLGALAGALLIANPPGVQASSASSAALGALATANVASQTTASAVTPIQTNREVLDQRPAPRPKIAPGAKVIEKRLEAKRAAQRARAAEAARQARARATRNAARDPKAVARLLLADRGWSGQFSCLNSLWERESGWNYRAYNPSSGAYGIPQALPGSKMGTIAPDWRTNPVTQIKWGLKYIADRYGTPCGAWGHSQSSGWY
jgi:hypothetical protein